METFLSIISWLYRAVKQNVFFLQSEHKHRPDIAGHGICVQKCLISTYNSIFDKVTASRGQNGAFLPAPAGNQGRAWAAKGWQTHGEDETPFPYAGAPGAHTVMSSHALFPCTSSKLIFPQSRAGVGRSSPPPKPASVSKPSPANNIFPL